MCYRGVCGEDRSSNERLTLLMADCVGGCSRDHSRTDSGAVEVVRVTAVRLSASLRADGSLYLVKPVQHHLDVVALGGRRR
jgi:hypothetical protein